VVSSSQKGRAIMDESGEQTIKYGVTPVDVMASMSGLDFVRAIFARRLPEPPIMQTVEPFDCTAEPGGVVILAAVRFGRSCFGAPCHALTRYSEKRL
jgi:hypothetical protein